MTFKNTGHAPNREELIKEAISVIMELNETQIICALELMGVSLNARK